MKIAAALLAILGCIFAVLVIAAPYKSGIATTDGDPVLVGDLEYGFLAPILEPLHVKWDFYDTKPAVKTIADVYKQARVIAKNAILTRLKDPGSAEFKNVAFMQEKNGQGVGLCGQVNSKNSSGAYSGYVDFLVVGDHATFRTDVLMQRTAFLDRVCNQGTIVETVDAF